MENKKNIGVPVAIILAGAIIAAAVYFRPSTGENGAGFLGEAPALEATDTGGQVAGAKVNIEPDEDDPVLGSAEAPVTIIEFTDVECPFCQRHHVTTWPMIKSEYIDTGKVKYVTKHFPLEQLHPRATPGAIAAQCANEQGKFYEYLGKMFANQQALADDNLLAYAGEVGLDQGRFEICVDNPETAVAVTKDQQAGLAAGVTGTPGFFINGKRLDGAQPFAQFKTLIDAELN